MEEIENPKEDFIRLLIYKMAKSFYSLELRTSNQAFKSFVK